MQVVSVDLGTAPMTASFFSPFLKIITVGMLRIPNSVAVEGLSSVFSLKNLSLPAYSFASSSMTGWIIRHGPHHGAQNSTRTGISDSTTSDFHVLSLTAPTSRAVFCASQTIGPPRGMNFEHEVLETDERVSWILRPLNWENLTEERGLEKEKPATGASDDDGRAEARGTLMVSSKPAIGRESARAWIMGGEREGADIYREIVRSVAERVLVFELDVRSKTYDCVLMNGWGV